MGNAISLGATSRLTVKVNDLTGLSDSNAAATKVESSASIGIVAERSMYRSGQDGNCSIGISE